MNYDDPRWEGLRGGYRVPYDPRNALRSLEHNENVDDAWNELWNELHHQGDVGTASYAAVPELVRIHQVRGISDWNTYSIVAIIEEARRSGRNPEMPGWLCESYQAAWRQLFSLALSDLRDAKEDILASSIIAVIAFEKGLPALGRISAWLEEGERREMLTKCGWF
jgi:hypothetical protein